MYAPHSFKLLALIHHKSFFFCTLILELLFKLKQRFNFTTRSNETRNTGLNSRKRLTFYIGGVETLSLAISNSSFSKSLFDQRRNAIAIPTSASLHHSLINACYNHPNIFLHSHHLPPFPASPFTLIISLHLNQAPPPLLETQLLILSHLLHL